MGTNHIPADRIQIDGPLPTIVTTMADGGETCDVTKRIDFNNASDRTWLFRHIHWAMANGRIIITQPSVSVQL